MVANLTSYYYSMLLVLAFLWPRYPAIGVSLLAASAATNAAAAAFDFNDDIFGAISVGGGGPGLDCRARGARGTHAGQAAEARAS